VVLLPENAKFLPGPAGAPEEELKTLLTNLFQKERSVQAAYLVFAQLDNAADPRIVIAVRANLLFGPEHLRAVGHISASTLGLERQVNIVLMSENLEQKIAAVCHPFFERKS
jgi:SseB protein C-terminal domain